MNDIEHEKWLEYERKIEIEWQIHQRKLEQQAKKKEKERRRIQDEYETEQKRIAHATEEKQRRIEVEKQRQIDLERRIQAFADGIGNMPPELATFAETNPAKELCKFFPKMGVCRYGHKCIWNHRRPKISKILLMPAFFVDIQLDQSDATEYGNDLALEHDDNELVDNFHAFFADIVPEFEQFGCIKHVVVCSNSESHLRGTVFIEYISER